ncbi:MAG: tetratricopeptide repeat protein [Gemmatimonadaceae bacterium]|nr:tetratricopeptide repeat protein [Gemmatimonadaceae bacterium]
MLVLSAPLATGCATATRSLPALEQEQRTNPGSAEANRSLGIAYYQAGKFTEAKASLDRASLLDPKDGATALYLGLAAEELNDYAAARRAYSSYLTFGKTSRVRGQLQSRLAALVRKELLAEAKSAVHDEATRAGAPALPRTVAVFPLRFSGRDTTLIPLERGLADLLITDLSRSAQLTLVERSRLQALVEELALQSSGRVDSTTTVRAGRLLRAGRLVRGSILQLDGTQLRLDAAVVDVASARVSGSAQGAQQLEQIFELEKQVALDLFRELGVTLTVAERNAIEQRPTRSLTAFLAYSQGLAAEDQGRYEDASRFFQEAVRIDPGFGSAQQKGQEARAAAAGAQLSSAAVEASLKESGEGAAAGGGKLSGAVQTAASDLNPSAVNAATGGGAAGASAAPPQKDPASAATNTEASTGQAKVVIVIQRPKTP